MAKTPAARVPAFVAASCLAFTFTPAHAERPAGSDFEVSHVPRANPNATRNDWRGPVTNTGSVTLPQARERIVFSYPGSDAASGVSPEASMAEQVETVAFADEHGLASWYGATFHGRPTASGELFDMNAMSAAHPTLPLPSLVRVINERNGREVVVRVNDRGPFAPDRIIDLSKRAASELGLVEDGVAPVTIRYVGPAPEEGTRTDGVVMASADNGVAESELQPLNLAEARAPSRPDLYGDMLLGGSEPTLGVADPGRTVATPAQKPKTAPQPASRPTASFQQASYASPTKASANFGPQAFVQVGAFTQVGNAQTMSDLVGQSFATDTETARIRGADYFRVFAGPFATREAAERARHQLQNYGVVDAFVVLR